jgi:hypothetical protein
MRHYLIKRIICVITFISLIGCDRQLHIYYNIVDKVDRVVITYKKTGLKKILTNIEIETFKNHLKRNIQPELQRVFINDVLVELYSDSKRIAFLLIYQGVKDIGFVNFNSDNLNFGFRLTYGIGMFIGGN